MNSACLGATLLAVTRFLLKAEKLTTHVPMLREVIEEAVVAWSCTEGVLGALAAARTAERVMLINDPAARRICLPEGLTAWGKPIEVGFVPRIYHAIIAAINGALMLGKAGAGS
jgi:hypothetical protein